MPFQIRGLQSDVEKAALVEKQLEETNTELRQMVEDAQDALEQAQNQFNETCSDEMAQLHSDITTLQNEKVAYGIFLQNFITVIGKSN